MLTTSVESSVKATRRTTAGASGAQMMQKDVSMSNSQSHEQNALGGRGGVVVKDTVGAQSPVQVL